MAGNEPLLWSTGYGSVILDDFYRLLPLNTASEGTLLDAGCGFGSHTRNWKAIAPKIQIRGCDLSSQSINSARGNYADYAEFAVADVQAMPYASNTFDYVASHEVVEHTELPERALADIFRVLKPGGYAAISTPNGASVSFDNLTQRLKRAFGRRGAPVGADHTRPSGFWRRELRRAGFSIERQVYDGIALDFQTYIAPAWVMLTFARWLEPLRIVPGLRYLLADRVKFLVRKPL